MQKTNTLFLLYIVLTIPTGKVKPQPLSLTQWHYIEVDNTKGKTIPATGHVNSQGFSWQAPLLNIWLNQQN